MAFKLSHIANEEALKGCSQADLEQLFALDSAFSIPRSKDNTIDCKRLAELFRIPQDIPREIANALYYIDALSTPDGCDSLQSSFEDKYPNDDFSTGDSCSAACSLKAWLKDDSLVKRVLAESSVENIQATDLFSGSVGPGLKKITKAHITAIAQAMDRWFLANRRGIGTEIDRFKRDGAFWFIVRHGDAFRREALINQKTKESEASFGYRELHDIVIYDPDVNELQIHADGKKLKEEYARVFSLQLFDDPDYFTPGGNISLAPLLSKKQDALDCGGIPGLCGARLTKIEYPVGNDQNEMITHTSDDLFVSFAERDAQTVAPSFSWDSITELTQATIKLQVGEIDGVLIGERSVRICPPNRLLFKRDNAAPLIQRFVEKNKFVKTRREVPDAPSDT